MKRTQPSLGQGGGTSPFPRACKERSVAGKEPGPDKARSQGRHTMLKLLDYSRKCCAIQGFKTRAEMSNFQLRTIATSCHPLIRHAGQAHLQPPSQASGALLIFRDRASSCPRLGSVPFVSLGNTSYFPYLAPTMVNDQMPACLWMVACSPAASASAGPPGRREGMWRFSGSGMSLEGGVAADPVVGPDTSNLWDSVEEHTLPQSWEDPPRASGSSCR